MVDNDFLIENGVLKKYLAFYKHSVAIPDTVTKIEKGAFANHSISSVTIPDSVVEIGEYAFCSCESLVEVNIPDSLINIGQGAFLGCHELIDSNGFVIVNSILFDYFGKEEHVAIPEGVTTISVSAFANAKIVTVTLPSTVTHIGREAFGYCERMEHIHLSDNLTFIGDKSFEGCKRLSDLTIPDNVTHIGTKAFSGCRKLAKNGFVIVRDILYNYTGRAGTVTVPDGVTRIEDEAFQQADVRKVILPDSVTHIGKYAFAFCRFLEEINVSNTVTSLGKGAFFGCDKLAENGMVIFNNRFCWCCRGIETLIIPDHVDSIDWRALRRKEFRRVVLSNGITEIGAGAFESCNNLESVTIPDSVMTIGENAFGDCEHLRDIEIPNGVTSIGRAAFSKCPNLREVVIPKSVTAIGKDAFSGSDNVVIYCTKDSFANAFATVNEIPWLLNNV